MKIKVECENCHKITEKYESNIKRTKHNYCSRSCASLHKIPHSKKRLIIDSVCEKCNKTFQQTIKIDSRDNNNISRFCSRTCANTREHTNVTKSRISHNVKNSVTFQINNSKRFKNYVSKLKKSNCKHCGIEFEFDRKSKISVRTYCSENCHLNDPYKKKMGGLRLNSGTGKSGWYNGIYCGSSYELAWIIFNIEHDIKFERNLQGFDYVFENKTHKYYPDFIQDGVYIEIKGFKRSNDVTKWSSFPYTLKILFKKDLKNELEYVVNKYGKNFISLYDIDFKNRKSNKCEICGEPCKNTICHNKKCSGLLLVKRKKEKKL